MWHRFIRLAAGLPLPALLACAAAGAAAQDRIVITAPELSRSGASNVYSPSAGFGPSCCGPDHPAVWCISRRGDRSWR